ncbi:NUDIX domain-containing protein [Streptomyces sp. H34-S4]|uniref:NUDIX domain-containing protein n=1 Tax=Streptomyces sp. H34-S4 TaxID=2996463 RepID=UPI00226DC542|nr:NUDIX domain-containing protein [Streptomyces sp. H34-S4]MCY0935970.1 NUDIX domain-containing protein [Streptomyces sp. H34-S4]
MIKHGTASTFVFAWIGGDWRLGLIEHPRLAMAMIPGGHVEEDESAAEAAWREVREETGLKVRPLAAPAATMPAGYPHPVMAQPWWITELRVPRDNHLPEDHVHVDHVFVAVAEDTEPVCEPEHPFTWLSEEEVLASESVFADTKILAENLFSMIAELAGQPTS